jgi:4-oxalocrotonate tautomerase
MDLIHLDFGVAVREDTEDFIRESLTNRVDPGRRLTEATVEAVGCSPMAVSVVFEDYPRSDWAIGGVLADEL